MKTDKITVVLRSALGLIFLAGPIARALHLAPEPAFPPMAKAFMGALADSGYMLPLLWSVHVAAAILLLSGFMVPLALVLLAPLIVNIDAFHLFLDPHGLPPAIMVTVLELSLAWRYRRAFAPLLRPDRVQATTAAHEVRANVVRA